MKDETILTGILAIVICGVIILATFGYSLLHKTEKVVTQPQVPTFQRGDCFEFNEEKETWDVSTPDGIVERVGYSNYLVLFRDEANKTSYTKYGSKVSIATFDQYYHKVECPDTWIKHTSSHMSNMRKG